MAVYDGYFDAVLNEDTGEYDRAYGSGDFTGYFEKIIGSGVCIHNNPDSFKVRFENGAAVVSPGYLFIRGYWLKNDADYTVPVTGTATLAIVAHLNMGKRMIEIEAVSVAQSYPDSLVLSLVNPAAGTAEDTRHNTDICGVIDTAGELSKKVQWAVNYIDNEVEARLAAAEAEINAQSQRLDAKIAEVQAVVDNITPPPVGTIQYSASQDVGPEWLRCDGSFINEADYPELVAALGKLTPSGDKFQLLSDGEIPKQISNGAICNGRMWVFSYSTKKLYGVDLENGAAIKEIPLTGDANFSNWLAPSNDRPIALSIVPLLSNPGQYKLCLAQYVGNGFSQGFGQTPRDVDWYDPTKFLIYWSDFSGDETSLSLTRPFSTVQLMTGGTNSSSSIVGIVGSSIPYVVSKIIDGEEKFCCIPCGPENSKLSYSNPIYFAYVTWTTDSSQDATIRFNGVFDIYDYRPEKQIVSFNKKNKGELVFLQSNWRIDSYPTGTFNRDGYSTGDTYYTGNGVRTTTLYAGNGYVVITTSPDISSQTVISRTDIEQPTSVSFSPVTLPPAKHVFIDSGAYLWGKDMYMLFVGTGIVFSRTLEAGSFGYLDTTSILGTITQYGYLDYAEDEGTLYIIGQDTTNSVKVAKIVLNTLYDYANDGAWLPLLASDGVPAYIKSTAKYDPQPTDATMKVTVLDPADGFFASFADVAFNGDALIPGTYTRPVHSTGTFTVGVKRKDTSGAYLNVEMNGAKIGPFYGNETLETREFNVADYISNGITLRGEYVRQ